MPPEVQPTHRPSPPSHLQCRSSPVQRHLQSGQVATAACPVDEGHVGEGLPDGPGHIVRCIPVTCLYGGGGEGEGEGTLVRAVSGGGGGGRIGEGLPDGPSHVVHCRPVTRLYGGGRVGGHGTPY